MSRELSHPLAPSSSVATSADRLRKAGMVLAGTVFLALCAHLSIPMGFTPVPLSLQPFGVLLLGLLLSPAMAAMTLGAYLAEGAIGLPVFAPGPVGIAHLLGPTAGYLLAYPMAAVLIAWLRRRIGRGLAGALVSAAAGDLVILLLGGLWLSLASHASFSSALVLAVAPFLPGDALKSAAAAVIATSWQRRQRRTA